MNYQIILDFWFTEVSPDQWFKKDLNFDKLIHERFLSAYEMATAGQLSSWRKSAKGRLAEIIVLDQFPRNMFRDTAKAFATDDVALNLAREAVRMGEDQMLTTMEKSFLYMPYMHSESKKMHQEAVRLFSQKGLENNLKFELLHKSIIDKFGRYPHRNAALGRKSTSEEVEFLKQENSSF